MGMVMNENDSSAQLYRKREAMKARAHEENLRLYDIMQATKARQRHMWREVKTVKKVSVMSRVKAALLSKNKKV
tara:strand:+ start:1068 stop:1289 length:222 start_codon:yes stop_codon:yes gene_type:complete